MVLEGLDGSGLSTHTKYLNSYMKRQGYKTFLTKEPTQGFIGNMVRSKIKAGNNTSFKSLQLLFCADRAKHLEDEIEPALKKGKVVICDRYFFSTLAYGFAAGVDFHWLYAVNRVFRKPDLTIFIDISPDLSLSRQKGSKRNVRLFERRESLGKVRAAYLNLAKRFGFRIVNGENTVNDTRKEVQGFVDRFMGIKER